MRELNYTDSIIIQWLQICLYSTIYNRELQIHAAILFLFITSEWKAVWTNLTILNFGESICLFYLSISLACILTHLTGWKGDIQSSR